MILPPALPLSPLVEVVLRTCALYCVGYCFGFGGGTLWYRWRNRK